MTPSPISGSITRIRLRSQISVAYAVLISYHYEVALLLLTALRRLQEEVISVSLYKERPVFTQIFVHPASSYIIDPLLEPGSGSYPA